MTKKRPSHHPRLKVSRRLQRKVSTALLFAILLTQAPVSMLAAGPVESRPAAAPVSTAPARAAEPARQGKGRATQEAQSERDASVARIKVEPGDATTFVKERLPLWATAFDGRGVPVGGVLFTWRVTGGPEGQAEVSPEGVFVAGAPGEYEVTVEGAFHVAAVRVIVESGRGGRVKASALLEDDDRYFWNDRNHLASRRPENRRGEVSEYPAAVNGNFSFNVPLLSQPGRGMDLALALTYNSRVWTAAPKGDGTWNVIYDIDKDWPAPGWSFSLPRMAVLGPEGAMLLEGDGTRHPFTGNTTYTPGQLNHRFEGNTTDGAFIRYTANGDTGSAYYPDGTLITFRGVRNAAGIGILTADKIVDAHGNIISIRRDTTAAGGGRISAIVDTLGRSVFFYYDSRKLLTAITAAGPRDEYGNVEMRTVARFHYRKLRLSYSFAGLAPLVRNPEPYVIDAIYFPGTSTGYWFGDYESYSSYGMLRRVIQQRGMRFTPATSDPGESLSLEGAISPGEMTTQSDYDYPLVASSTLTEPPTYSQVSESWAGMDGDPRVTRYESKMNLTPRQVKITQPDGTYTVQYSENLSSLPDDDSQKLRDGVLLEQEFYAADGTRLRRTKHLDWELGYLKTPRAKRVENYIYLPGRPNNPLMTAVETDYGEKYNSPDVTREYDFNGTPIRTTRMTYRHFDNDYTYGIPYIINRVSSREVFAGSINGTRLSYAVSGYGENWEFVSAIGSAVQWEFRGSRGQVTSTTVYADAVGGTGGLTDKFIHDAYGNLIVNIDAAGIRTTSAYNPGTQFAYPASVTITPAAAGSTLKSTSSAVYDFNTGLITAATDANGVQTRHLYDPATTRPAKLLTPTGAYAEISYDDFGLALTSSTYAPGGRLVAKSVSRTNGLGQTTVRETLTDSGQWSTVETKYDLMNRPWKTSLPYFPGQTPRLSTREFDGLGRLTKSTAADGSVTSIAYDDPPQDARPLPAGAGLVTGQTARTIDPWGRERWALLNSDGKLIEVVEPKAEGNGLIGTDGHLTKYTYDAVSRLEKVVQGEQTRSFRYDGLGRMTHSKVAEKADTLDNGGLYVGSPAGDWSGHVSYDPKGNVEYTVDARGVKTVYAYADPLNRLTSVEYRIPTDPNKRDNSSPILPAATSSYTYKLEGNPFRLAQALTDAIDTQDLQAPGLTEKYDYDGEGRLSQQTLIYSNQSKQPLVTNYDYDELGRLKSETYPEQYGTNAARKKVRPQYGFGGQVTGLLVNDTPYASLASYDAAGRPTSLTVGPSGMYQETESYQYDEFTGLLTHQSVKRGGLTLLDLTYDYLRPQTTTGRTGRITSVLDNLDHSKDRAYDYDALGRLKQVTGGAAAWWQQYSYDRYGNRLSITKGGALASAPRPETPAEETLAELAALADAPTIESLLGNDGRRDVTDAPGFGPLSGAPPTAPKLAAAPAPAPAPPAAAFVNFNGSYHSHTYTDPPGTAQVTMRNTGTLTWYESIYSPENNVRLCSVYVPGNFNDYRMEGGALPNGNHWPDNYVTYRVGARPQRAGTYYARYQLCRPGPSGAVYFGAITPLLTFEVPPSMANDALIISQNVPTTMNLGQTYTVGVTVKNNGTAAWHPSQYLLESITTGFDALLQDGARAPLPRTVNPGETVTIDFPVTAPYEPKTYKTRWQMKSISAWDGTPTPFGDATAETSVQVVRPQDGALFTTQRAPSWMVAGQTYPVSVAMKNSGANAWQQSLGYALGSLDQPDNTTWGLNRVQLPQASVAATLDTVFNFNVTAPAQPGRYSFQWGMLREAGGAQRFGEPSPQWWVDVYAPGATPTPTPLATPTPTPVPRINVGLGFNGGTASASSSRAANGPNHVNDGIRMGISSQGGPGSASWVDATTGFPDSVQLTFDRPRKISEINVIAGQDFNFITSVIYPPTLAMIAGQYNSEFDVMYWDTAQGQWALVPDGHVVGNNRVWRRFVFPEVSTDKIMVAINSANVGYSHLVEVEAYEVVQPTPTPTPTPTPQPEQQQPHGSGPAAVPGVIQAEDFDRGGDGVAYHDDDAANNGGAYRTAEGVDIEPSADTGGGYDVGWTAADEWLEYTVRVPTSGLYKLEARVASPVAGGRLRFDFDGVNKTGEMLVPNTGGWQSWQTVNAFVTLQAGVQVMRANVTAAGFNFNHVRLTAVTPGAQPANLAAGKLATQSSDYGAAYTASRAVDNSTDGNSAMGSVSSTALAAQPWWQVDLGSVQSVDNVRVWNRTDCCSERLSDFHVFVSDAPFASHDLAATLAQPGVSHIYFPGQSSHVSTLTVNRAGRYVRVQLDGSNYLSMAEVQVWGGGAPITTGLLADDFNDNTRDPLKWARIDSDPLAVVEETNQRLQIAVNTGSATRDGYASLNTVDLTDGRAVVEVPHASTWDYTETTLGVWDSANNAAAMLVRQGNLYLRLVSPGPTCDMCLEGDGGLGTDDTSVPYSPTQHRFWRIRHDAASDALYWEASADGGTWQMLRSAARPFAVNGLQVRLTAGNLFGVIPIGSGTPPQADAAFFDNFKVEINNPNNPPTVSITAPAPGAVFTAPASATIKVAAGDADGSVVKVEFFVNGTKLGEDTAAPFELNVSNAVAGTYVLTATAHDNRAAATTSAPVTVTVTRPSVNVAAVTRASEPSAAGAFSVTRSGDTSQPLTVSLSYGGTATSGADYTALPPTVTLPAGQSTQTLPVVPLNDSLAEGTETVIINVSPSSGYVAGGNSTATVELLDDENLPPAVTLTGPHNGASFTPPLAALDLTADASDLDGSVVKVEFFDGATKLGEDTSSPYALAWANLATGTYSLTAKATDDRGATSTSAAAVVTVTAVTALADDFNDNATDLSKWTVALPAGGTVAEQNQRLELTPPASAAGYSGYVSRPNLDLTGGRASVEVIQTTQLISGIETYFTLSDPTTGNYLFFVTGGGGLLLQERTNGVIPPRTTLAYDAAQHRHWRIRHDEVADTVNWETSPDGVNWTARRTSPRPFPLTNLQAQFYAGKYSAGVPAGTAIFDNFRASRYQTLNDEFNNFTAGQALLVVGSTTLNASDAALKTRLEALGFTVTVRDAAAAATTDATGKSLLVISETCQSASVNTKFRDVTVPALVMEMQVYDDMQMTGPTLGTDYYSVPGQTQITINAPTHPLAAGLTGTVSVTNSPLIFGWAKPAASAVRVATWAGDSTRVTVFGYEKGMLMNGIAAPARRVGLFPMMDTPAGLNNNGWALFDAAARWATDAGVLNTTRWQYASPESATAVTVANQQLRITLQPNTPGTFGVRSAATYELSGRTLRAEVVQPASQAGSVRTTLQAQLDERNYYSFSAEAGSLHLDAMTGGVNNRSTVAFDATRHRHWRLRHDAASNSLSFEASGNGRNWETLKTLTAGFDLGALRVLLLATATDNRNGWPGAAVFDNVVIQLTEPNQPPAVSITAPAAGATFITPATAEITADASDPDGSVVKVEFYAGTLKLGEDATAPYAVTVSNAAAGAYSLTAKATDNSGATTTSAPISVTVNKPTVTVTATDASASEGGSDSGLFTITRSGNTSAPLTVGFELSGTAVRGTDYMAQTGTVTIPAGAATAAVQVSPIDDQHVETGGESVTLTLVANNAYAVGQPSAATVTIADNDTHPPTVALTSPLGGASFTAPATITLAATAADSDGTVARVEFRANGSKVGEDSSAPYELNWENVAPGEYLLTAVAFDNANASAVSAPVTLSVVMPAVTVTATDAGASEPGTNAGQFTVTRTGPTAAALTVNLSAGGTATAGSDYTALPATVTIPAGVAAAVVQVTATDDLTVESEETVLLTLGGGTTYTVGQPSTATVTITDNDLNPPSISIITPKDGATFIAPTDITIDTLTPYNSNPIKRVEFLVNNVPFGESLTAPFSFNWPNVAAGTYALTARVTTESSVFSPLAVNNSGFEVPSLSYTQQYNPVGGTWVFVGGAGIAGNGSGMTNGNPPSPEGTQVGFVQGGSGSHFSQQVSGFQANTNYSVSFAAAQRANCCGAGGQDFDVYLDTTLLGTLKPAGTSYALMSTPFFQTTAGTHTVKFVGRNSLGGDNMALIDDVRVLGSTRLALLVVGSTTLSADDAALKTRLEALGFTVTVRDAAAAATTDATGKSLLVISETCQSASVNTKFRDVTVPALVMEMQVYDDMQMTGPTLGTDYYSEGGQTQVAIFNSSHPLAAGLTGTVSVTTSPINFGWGKPALSAARVATMTSDTTKFTVFGYESGVMMNGLMAPARRVGLFPMGTAPSVLNNNGWALFDAAVRWAANITTTSATATSAPVNITVSKPTVTVTASDANASEAGPDAGSFTIMRDGGLSVPLTVQVSAGGTATSGDYAPLGTSVTIPAGAATAAVQLSPIDDQHVEAGGESVTLTLIANSAYAVGQPSAATVTIADNDTHPPTVALTSPLGGASFTAPAAITLAATAADSDGTVVRVEFRANGSKVGEDFAAPYELNWENVAPGEYLLTAVAFDNANASTVSAPVTLSVVMPVVTVTATDAGASEPGTNAGQFTVTRTGPTAAALTVNLSAGGTATAGSDYTALPATVTIPAGVAAAVVQVTPTDDLTVENEETVLLTLGGGTTYTVGSPSSATVTITDNDTHPPTVSLTSPLGGASFTAPATITLAATAADSDGTIVRVEFYANGSKVGEDSSAPYEFIWANVGPDLYRLTAVATDNTNTATESAQVDISVVLPTVTVTASDANASEAGSDVGAFTFTRDGELGAPLTVNYQIAGTAVGDSDYTRLDGQVTFKALASSTTVLVRPINDSTVEPSETVTVALGPGSVYQVGQPSSATVTIADNDAHTRVNVALAANGATAAASSTHPDAAFAASRAINGTRAYDGGYWNDNSHGTFPDSLEITFAGAKTIDEIDVYSLQDNYGAGEPDEALTFTQFGLTHFDLQYQDASSGAWFSVPGASVSGNDKVWRRFIFAPITTTGLKLTVYRAVDGWSRVVEVEAYEATNLALGKAAAQSSTHVFNPPGDAWRAVDGNTDGNYMAGSVTHTNGESQPWWQVDLGGVQAVGSVRLWNRTDCCSERLTDFHVFVSDNPFTSNTVAGTQAQPGVSDYHVPGAAGTVYTQQVHRTGRYVRVQLSGAGVVSLAEFQVWRDGPGVTTGCSAQQDLPLDLFVRNFYQAALDRQPSAAELQQVGGTLRAARAQGEQQLVAAAQALGRAIFLDGAEYEARDRSNRDFVWDIYWAYLSHGPDQAGWNFWTDDVERWGREAKLPAFDTYPDFTNQVRRICPGLPDTNQAPVANAGGPYTGSISEPVQFDGGASSDPDGTLAARQWNFGDGLTATGESPRHAYARGDTYPVMLTVKDNRGALHSATTTVAVQGPQTTTNGATYVTQNVPATMNAGQTYDVTVTLRNTGTSRWTTHENFLLGAVNPIDGTAWKVAGSPDGRARLPREVAPNETVNIVFKVVAPSAPGVHNFQRRMLQHGGDWFGDSTANVAVNVVGPVEVPTDGDASLAYDNASNRITSPGYQYDEEGSMTRMSGQGAGGGRQMQYDAAGRLVKVLNEDGTTLIAVYTYGKGRKRLTSSENGIRTYYVAGMGGVISEYVEGDPPSANLVWSKNYIYFGAGGLLATQTAAGGGSEVLEFHHPDRLGSRLISSPTTGRHFEQVTLPFGTAFEAESGDSDRRRFAGYDRSAGTGLDYAVNRFYSARQGRFTQVDPIGMAASSIDTPQSLNLYSYVNNDPVNQTDPDGLTAFLWPSFFSFGFGFRFGGGSPMFGISSNYMIGGIPQPTSWHWFSPTRATPSAPPAQVTNPNSSSSLADGGVMTPAGGAPPRWPPATHDFIVFSSLPGLEKDYLHEVQRGSREVDVAGGWFPSTMNPGWAYAHSMVPGHWILWWGQKKARREAIKAQQAFITKHINKARELMERANKGGSWNQKHYWIKEAHFHFGVAMHPVMDYFSPPHGPWLGFFYSGNIVQDIMDNLAHKHAESGPPSTDRMNKMVTVIREYYLQILPPGARRRWSKEAFTLRDEY